MIPWSVRASTWALQLQHPEEQLGQPGAAPAPSLCIPSTADGSRPARLPAWVKAGHVLEHEKQSQLKMRGWGSAKKTSQVSDEPLPACPERSPHQITPGERVTPACTLALLLCPRKLVPKFGILGKLDAAVVRGIVLRHCFPELPGAHPWKCINPRGKKGHAPALPPGWNFPCDPLNKPGTGGWGAI